MTEENESGIEAAFEQKVESAKSDAERAIASRRLAGEDIPQALIEQAQEFGKLLYGEVDSQLETSRKEKEAAILTGFINEQLIEYQHHLSLDYSDFHNLDNLSKRLEDDTYWAWLNDNPQKKDKLAEQVFSGVLADKQLSPTERAVLEQSPRTSELFYSFALDQARNEPESFKEKYGLELYEEITSKSASLQDKEISRMDTQQGKVDEDTYVEAIEEKSSMAKDDGETAKLADSTFGSVSPTDLKTNGESLGRG